MGCFCKKKMNNQFLHCNYVQNLCLFIARVQHSMIFPLASTFGFWAIWRMLSKEFPRSFKWIEVTESSGKYHQELQKKFGKTYILKSPVQALLKKLWYCMMFVFLIMPIKGTLLNPPDNFLSKDLVLISTWQNSLSDLLKENI